MLSFSFLGSPLPMCGCFSSVKQSLGAHLALTCPGAISLELGVLQWPKVLANKKGRTECERTQTSYVPILMEKQDGGEKFCHACHFYLGKNKG
jgi:hypothetical protein